VQIEVTVNTVQELIAVARIEQSVIAEFLGLSPAMASHKVRGSRTVFLDEIPKLAAAINSSDVVTITEDELRTLYRKSGTLLKVRGLAE